jgi:5-methylcytosine-specific restriction endonuclease McrA
VDRSNLDRLLEEVAQVAHEMEMPLEQALTEKRDELRARLFLKCLPNNWLRDRQVPAFLRLVVGGEPPPGLLEQVLPKRRKGALGRERLLQLEKSQLHRCALCGTVLVRASEPQVDHIVPLALGGGNSIDNLQLLCRRCNQGKAGVLGWIVGAQYVKARMDYRMRYCVLARAHGRCEADGCHVSARTATIRPMLRISRARGGRPIFDNLMALCETHVRQWQERERTRILRLRRGARRRRRYAA